MIEVDNLSKNYGRIRAVKGISFTARPGEVLGLLGPNGAGKSTTIKSITGLIKPTSGSIRLAGFDVVKDLRAKELLGYVPDRPYLYEKLTGRELLRFLCHLRGLSQHEHKVQEWLEFFSLHEFGNELIEAYSHGMRQKLTFIAALIHEPPVLVIDEPMVGLDPRAALQVRKLMKDYARQGRTVLLTTHSMDVAEEVADRVIVMHRGSIAAEGNLAELRLHGGIEHDDLETIFLRLTEEDLSPKS